MPDRTAKQESTDGGSYSRNDDERAVLQLKSRARPEAVPSTAGDEVLGGLGELARAASELGVDVGIAENTAALGSATSDLWKLSSSSLLTSSDP